MRPLRFLQNFSELQTRFISALLIILVVSIPLLLGGWVFILALALLSLLLVPEWSLLARTNQDFVFSLLLAGALLISLITFALYGAQVALGTNLFLCIIGITLSSSHKNEFFFVFFLGLFLLPITIVSFASIRLNQNGLTLALWLIIIVTTTDSLAYFVGRKFGGPKIAPSISPKKTWSGCLGGIFFAVLAACSFSLLLAPPQSLPPNSFPLAFIPAMISALAISIVAQLGDFLISFLKRKSNIKDTGTLIPGHGGLFDRLDSYILAAPSLAFLIHLWPILSL